MPAICEVIILELDNEEEKFRGDNNFNCSQMKLITDNIQRLRELCQKYHVRKMYVFGSILTDRFGADSDVDLSVDFNRDEINRKKLDWADLFFDFIHELEHLFRRKVDLVDEDCVKNKYFRRELDNTKILVYES